METKKCAMCGEEKATTNFNRDASRKDGLQYRCKSCHSLMKKKHYNNNKDAILAKNKQYRQSHGESILANKRKYRNENREKIREFARKYAKSDRQRNPAKHATKAARRRLLVKQAIPTWADLSAINGLYFLSDIFKRAGVILHVDHVVPINSDIVCGLHCEANLQLLPAFENTSKGNRHWPDMW